MTMDPDKVKHLELIQGVVTRLAGNSFLMKGWSVTLTAGLFALAAKDANQWYIAIALLPAICFWGLDAYYLWQERLFRKLYDAVREGNPAIPSFSMDPTPVSGLAKNYCQALFAAVVLFYYGPILATIGAILFIVIRGGN